MPADLLVLGHIVKDIVPGGWRAGGSVLYTAAQASRLGLRVSALTVCGSDVAPRSILPDVDWRIVDDVTTTSFENRYAGDRREQRILTPARPLDFADLSSDWQDAPLVLFATVFQDVDPQLPRRIAGPGRLVGLAAQGWLRRREGDRVVISPVEPHPAWLTGDIVFVSEEDVTDAAAVSVWLSQVPIVVLTRAERGCTVWTRDARHDLPAIETNVVDPTGAGDVFAAAFLVKLSESQDALASARFATSAAALAVRGVGLEGIAGREEIEALQRAQAPVSAR